jgi:hypothetical protein
MYLAPRFSLCSRQLYLWRPINHLNGLVKLYMHIYFYFDLLEIFMEVPVLAFDT